MDSEAGSSQVPKNPCDVDSSPQLQPTLENPPQPPATAQTTEDIDSIEQPHQSVTKDVDEGPSPLLDVEKGVVVQTVQTAEAENDNVLAWNSLWVLLGIFGMLSGTLIVHSFLLPKIYVCPAGATCQGNYDPTGNIIPRLQSLMQYWLQGGVAIAGIGLTKLIAYISRFVVSRNEGCTIGSLENTVRAADGGLTDALLQLTFLQKAMAFICRLLKYLGFDIQKSPAQPGTSLLGIIVLLQIGIGLFISFVISFSITSLHGSIDVYAPFDYSKSFALPRADMRFFTNEELIIADQLNIWLRPPSGTGHPTTVFDGTLVSRDNRTIDTANPQPTGPRITGEISCGQHGWNVSVLPANSTYFKDGHAGNLDGVTAYNFTTTNQWYVAYSYTTLASKFISNRVLQDSVTSRLYLWASNTSSVIPNATAFDDGGIYYAVCNHTVRMVDLPPVSGHAQAILPGEPIIYSNPADLNARFCPSDDPLSCLAWSLDEVVLAWYQANASLRDLVPFSCLEGLLAAFDSVSDVPECDLTSDRWAKTLSTTLDALIATVPRSGKATQYLWASTEAINTDRWWIQVTIPGATFILYLLCVAYIWYLSNWGKSDLKEIDFAQVLCQEGLKVDKDNIRNTPITVL